ncbi:PREDICTED: GLYMA_05G105500 [Prunus dulcis]|uniref:PREDICTED: GLYMA_05G105500 n=1 Tax=Prunus dulcis TaxID=3755 RepID=A0A5E4F8I4_PRUDU|nr:PREDICTED: GLYMA_05G105500 [Prunus dulcis]
MGEFSSSSSSEEDGDSEWKAAINSAAAGASSVMSSFMNGFSANENGGGGGGGEYNQSKTQQLPKHYQIKAQKLLDEIIGKSLEIVNDPLIHLPDDEAVVDEDEGCIRLFKNAPPGIVFDHVDEQPLRKRPRILPGREINEKSKKTATRICCC